MIKQIIANNKLLAIIIRHEIKNKGTHFLTPENAAFQVGIIARNTGEYIPAHKHLPVEINQVGIKSEFIYIQFGKVKIKIFSDSGEEICEETLVDGDALLQLAGGHSFYFEIPTQMMEVKQGPYTNTQQDKVYYETNTNTC